MKLVYWVSEMLDDSTAYSVRGRRRRDVVEALIAQGYDPKNLTRHGPIHKVEVEYDNVFDLLDQCLGEGGIYEGSEEDYATAMAYDQRFQRPNLLEDDEHETLEGVPDDDDDDEREYGPHDANWYA
jgi:hypothetical protein